MRAERALPLVHGCAGTQEVLTPRGPVAKDDWTVDRSGGVVVITLVLMRHAKSDWSHRALSDHERPLNGRGQRDAPVMAERVAETGLQPDVILSSTAVRARTTARELGAALGVAVTLVPELYGASADTLLSHAAKAGALSVVVVAHDPGVSDLATELSGGGIDHMPTAAVATFMWESDDWDVAAATPPAEWNIETPR